MTKVLLILIDDLGVDYMQPYYQRWGQTWTTVETRTPVMLGFAQNGLLFHRAYSMPVCSHSRYTIHTGRMGFRANLGTVVQPTSDEGGRIPLTERFIPELLRDYAGVTDTAFFGKWHLTDASTEAGGIHAPLRQGYKKWAGVMGNLGGAGGQTDYTYINSPNEVVPTAAAETNLNYATLSAKQQADDTINWLLSSDRERHWFCNVSFNLVHSPWDELAAGFHTYDTSPVHGMASGGAVPPLSDDFLSHVECVDTQIGRILAQVDFSDTTVIIASDNGTPETWTQDPFDPDHAKGTAYDYGVNVPMMVRGSAVVSPGDGTNARETHALVHTLDFAPTILEMFGVDIEEARAGTAIDGTSFLSVLRDPNSLGGREYIYSDKWADVANPDYVYERTLKTTRYSLVRVGDGADEFYDLWADPHESSALNINRLQGYPAKMYAQMSAKLDEIEVAQALKGETRVSLRL
jgi:arylsulfatase A-like enzyme